MHIKDNKLWSMCNNRISMFYSRSKIGSLHLYPELVANNLKIWVFSGNTDAAVPTAGTLYWFNKLVNE